ncbi:MAG: J domain-containing protein [Geobacteraceae bacterium]|nr:J domain-containing protein [Geobacteraceae bacterium]
MTHVELKDALTVFGFSERDQPTMAQVKRRHRELSRKYHPDLQGDAQHMQVLNNAATILMSYLQSYRFSFTEEEFYRQNPDELLRKQFATDPWGSS